MLEMPFSQAGPKPCRLVLPISQKTPKPRRLYSSYLDRLTPTICSPPPTKSSSTQPAPRVEFLFVGAQVIPICHL